MSEPFAARADAVIPGGTSTGSKRREVLYGGDAEAWRDLPTHAAAARGCEIVTTDGRALVDLTMALGAVALGYADAEVTAAVVDAARRGPVCGLPPREEVEVAEALCAAVASVDAVRFLKTGAEATAAALRIARTATGRTRVIASGYFGWHDWSASAETRGVPDGARSDVAFVPFDDLATLERAVDAAGDALAAIVVEPVVEHAASAGWLLALRAHADRMGAVLVFDEIKTAFRFHRGGAQAALGVRPDLTVFGKALANGYPLAAVGGRRDVMDAAVHTWISSTLATESTALAAAGAVLARHAREDVCARLGVIGASLRAGVEAACVSAGLPIRVEGPDVMWRLVSPEPGLVDALVRAAVGEGVLLKRGAYCFAALPHEERADVIARGVARAAQRVAEARRP